MVELKNISESFGDIQILNGASFCLEKGVACTMKGVEQIAILLLTIGGNR